jgi:flagellar basal body-associated protein FliL
MLSKKAQGLSISTVIIIVLCLLVLGVGIYMLVGASSDGATAISCPSKGGICMDGSCEAPYSPHPNPDAECGPGEVCCKLI